MIVGIPKEIKNNENRVSLTPAGAHELVQRGHTVYIQHTAGINSGFSDEEYENFKQYAIAQKFSYDKQSEKVLKQLKSVAKFEGYDVDNEIKALEAKLTHNESYDFDHWKSEIKKLLNNEIMLRYYYRRGAVRNSLNDDKILDAAKAVLDSPQNYSNILKPTKKK